VLDWRGIDHVLLDMDGTLLDLRFDTQFWLELLPARYAELNGLTLEDALGRIRERMAAWSGQLGWYCVDQWSQALGFDVAALKQQHAHGIRYRDTALAFLEALAASSKHVMIVTNAHPATIEIKRVRTDIHQYVDAVVSSHELGAAKEQDEFWPALRELHSFDPERTLFIDDSLPVLRAAHRYGIGRILAVSQPDSGQAPRDIAEFETIRWFTEILPLD
jgi:putative hydrolase of the HAD superfamily